MPATAEISIVSESAPRTLFITNLYRCRACGNQYPHIEAIRATEVIGEAKPLKINGADALHAVKAFERTACNKCGSGKVRLVESVKHLGGAVN